MRKRCTLLFLVCLLGEIPAAMLAQDARTILTNVSKAMGADNLKTLRFSAMGSHAATIGQNMNPKTAWPVVRVKSYAYEADFGAGTSHVEFIRLQNGVDQLVRQDASADSPWNTQFDYWLSPFAFIKAALANKPVVRSETMLPP